MKDILNTVKLLRFPFSIFLLPISLFSFYYLHPSFDYKLIIVLFVWYILVFPSSNGYNSFHDKDTGPIGGLENPPLPTIHLLYISNIMDALALVFSFILDISFTTFVFIYIIFSRLYSNRKVRIKKYPVFGFLVVFLFQGVWIFIANIFAFKQSSLIQIPSIWYSGIATSFFIATIYPLTQIYQHEADRKDGVKTLSLALGYNGTFLFSAIMFGLANLFIFLSFQNNFNNFLIFNIIMSPSTIFFIVWALKSFHNKEEISFKNTMRMLVLSSFLTNLYFAILLLL